MRGMPIDGVIAILAETARRRAAAWIETAVNDRPPDPEAPVGAFAPFGRRVGSCAVLTFHPTYYPYTPGRSASPMRHNTTLRHGIFYDAVTSPATNSLTGIAASARGSAIIALIDSAWRGLKCAATLASNFFTSRGLPSSRRLRWPMG